MELTDLIRALCMEINAAELAKDIGNVKEAREHLRLAKQLLDNEFDED